MVLSFYGAAREVTGSSYYLNVSGKKVLIDCGMEQGRDVYENEELPVSPSEIEYILLTHAHLDHSGLIPLMYARGFRGKIYATKATSNLCDIMLRDSAHIKEFEAEWSNRKAKRSGNEEVVPLYTTEDAIHALTLFVPCEYHKDIPIFDGLSIKFYDAGHLLGSSSIEVTVTENGVTKVLAFSGDIGKENKPILKDPEYLKKADYVVMESTYGGRFHDPDPDYVSDLAGVIQRTFDRGGNVVIPAFAVGRTQEMLYFIRAIKERGLIKGHGNFKVILDSPLAIEATHIFGEEGMECFDEETINLVKNGINPISFDGLETSLTAEQSKLINQDTGVKVILSASGMCDAGRIKHHLKHNLWRKECCVLFVGYQAEGTLGRLLQDGIKTVKIFGESIHVEAEIATMKSISGHADDNGLMRWIKSFDPMPARVFVVHGEDLVAEEFANRLGQSENLKAVAPYNGDGWDLIEDRQVKFGTKEKHKKTDGVKASPIFQRLLDTEKRLSRVIEEVRGYPNKDLARFTDQLISLINKWER